MHPGLQNNISSSGPCYPQEGGWPGLAREVCCICGSRGPMWGGSQPVLHVLMGCPSVFMLGSPCPLSLSLPGPLPICFSSMPDLSPGLVLSVLSNSLCPAVPLLLLPASLSATGPLLPPCSPPCLGPEVRSSLPFFMSLHLLSSPHLHLLSPLQFSPLSSQVLSTFGETEEGSL